MAGYRHSRSHARSVAIHPDDRNATRAHGRLPGGDCLSLWVYFGRQCRGCRRRDEEQPVRRLSSADAQRTRVLKAGRMKVIPTPIPGAFVLEPRVFEDDRGFFLESYNEKTFTEIGITERFVQDNHSYSKRGVLRGLHYQVIKTQGKLVRVVSGEVLDVFLDLRKSSPTFGRWHGVKLSGENRRMAWIPVGFAHGFYVIADAHVLYKSTE